jgi:two-component system chemotaxis sensor kinase CheA
VDAAEYAQLFLTESREHVTAVNQALLELERGPSRPEAAGAVDAIFRAVHTIKGMAGAMPNSPMPWRRCSTACGGRSSRSAAC